MELRKGRQTPTQSVILPYTSTLGREAIDLYTRTGRQSQEWQSNLIYDIMAINDDGLWVHVKFGYSVSRRNGKNEIAAMREKWGLLNGEEILHTAHRTTTAHTAWERLCMLLDKEHIPYQSLKALGRERIEVEGGGKAEFRTRSAHGGLGEGFDLLVIDEAQEYTVDQESALKYVVSSSKNPQIIFCGTPPTPISSGTVFTKLRSNVLAGETVDTGWAEWSVERQSDPHDKNLWYETNPSMGTILTERIVTAEIGEEDDIDFNIQRLGLWIRYNQKSAINKTEWENLKVDILPQLRGELFAGIKYGVDGASVALSIAVKTEDGRIFLEAIDCRSTRAGNAWLIDFLRAAPVRQTVIDGSSGQELLAQEMKDARIKAPILPKVKEIIVANASFEQALFAGSICHKGQPSLAEVVSNCEKRAIGSNGGFGYKSLKDTADICLMDSMILACWACSEAKEKKKQRVVY